MLGRHKKVQFLAKVLLTMYHGLFLGTSVKVVRAEHEVNWNPVSSGNSAGVAKMDLMEKPHAILVESAMSQ